MLLLFFFPEIDKVWLSLVVICNLVLNGDHAGDDDGDG